MTKKNCNYYYVKEKGTYRLKIILFIDAITLPTMKLPFMKLILFDKTKFQFEN